MATLPAPYLINLDRSASRLALFRERNRHLTNVTRVAGVDGGMVSRAGLEAAGYIAPGLNYQPGALGASLSHIRLWEKAAEEDRAITVFEDDAVLSHQFEQCATQIISTLPRDWDFIAWGSNLPPSYIWVNLGISKVCLQPYGSWPWVSPQSLEEFQKHRFFGGPIRLLHAFGLNAYSISAEGARRALAHCLPLRNRMIEFEETEVTTPDLVIDIALCGLYPSIKAFICLPPLSMTLLGFEPSVIAEINNDSGQLEGAVSDAPH
jgi:GR25 family glycosyltransferase involved in LPS biosynthesis